ncbi:Holliday junction resolvase [Candidatus Woesearchaeota archaeon]|nr:Holliday junction resolvase [Candidatus Woesearchaeota archaeon]
MSLKRKGIQAEREIIHMLWERGWAALRVAGSGSMQFPSPDILAGNRLRVLAIECKVSRNDKKYFLKDEIKQLNNFSSYFGAESWVALKYYREEWRFINTEDLRETKRGYCISKDVAKIKGLLIDELLQLSK